MTPLMLAARGGHATCVQMLLDHRADTALVAAAMRSNPQHAGLAEAGCCAAHSSTRRCRAACSLERTASKQRASAIARARACRCCSPSAATRFCWSWLLKPNHETYARDGEATKGVRQPVTPPMSDAIREGRKGAPFVEPKFP